MAFLEYMLLALLGSVSATPAGTLARTFAAETVAQRGGGAEEMLGQAQAAVPASLPVQAG